MEIAAMWETPEKHMNRGLPDARRFVATEDHAP
jgi:hypothetical protein